jgi:GH3 auxin-responsive promoter.
MWPNSIIHRAHSLVYHFSKIGYRRYKYSLSHVESAQRNKLKELLQFSFKTEFGRKHNLSKDFSWEDFKERIPITEYPDYEPFVARQKENGGLVVSGETFNRYQPTSGSTSKIKWIPYTKKFLSECDEAIAPWIVDIYKREKRLFYGKHYWSLSWIPTELRNKINTNANDDLKLLPFWKRLLMSMTMAVPNDISFASSSEGSIIATLAYLASTKNLALISVWSPTFALNLFEQMKKHRLELADILKEGHWGNFQDELSFIPCPRSEEASSIMTHWDGTISSDFFMELWPTMAMISSWDCSSSTLWAHDLENLFPKATFQGKGLWATEGVVTIPFEGKYPLAVTSHFYEFEDLESENIYPAWGLEKGQVVKPLLTTGSGFLRYALRDRLKVVDFIDGCPCFSFLGRIDGVDLVGEKLSPEIAMNIIERVSDKYDIRALSLLGVTQGRNGWEKPNYVLLCESDKRKVAEDDIAQYIEEILQESFHYKLARDIDQLSPAKALVRPNARELYIRRGERRGMTLGDMKIEPLIACRFDELHDIVGITKRSSHSGSNSKNI